MGATTRLDGDVLSVTGTGTVRGVDLDLHAGEASATVLTNDLTHDYVHENSAYAS